MFNRQMKSITVILWAVLLLVGLFMMQPATPAFAGITPTAVPPTPPPPPPPTSTPAPPPPPPSATDTPIPTPEAIPEMGAGPSSGQAGLTAVVLSITILLLAASWWKAWQLYRQE